MILSAKNLFGTGLALGFTALSFAAQGATPFANLPLWFEAGTVGNFTAHASDAEFSISATGTEFMLTKNSGATAGCYLRFVGANPAAHIAGDRKLTGTVNYLIGSDPGQWHGNVPTFAQVRVEDVYPGINVVYYGNEQKLEYDFNLAAGVSPSAIALRFDGSEKVSVDAQGELVISFGSGEVIQHPPVAYQIVHGVRQEITAGYTILDAHTAAFALGHYDRSQPVVIDPVLSYSSYFGGNYGDTGWAIAVNTNDGSIYVAGQTFSTKDTNNSYLTFSTPGASQTNYSGGKVTGDAFVARFNIEYDETGLGTNLSLSYATYLGGSGNDGALGVAVDTNGDAFVTGFTDSTNFPMAHALYNSIGGVANHTLKTYLESAFVTELNPDGSRLVYSTYLGGSSMDAAFGITLDDVGDAYVTGYTFSTNFPCTTDTAYQPSLACTNTFYINANAFVAEISPGGTNLNYSTYLGGTNFDQGRAIAYSNGKLFVAGYTASTNFPVLNYLPAMKSVYTNIFTNTVNHVLKTNVVVWTNYFNGGLLNGTTNKYNLASDAFVAAFTVTSPTNLSLLYSTFLGGSNEDRANGIAADANGNAYVVGYTCSTNFPNTVPDVTSSYVHTNGINYVVATNAFLTKIGWDGTNASITYSAMFGGRGRDIANGIALDPLGNAYVVGSASSTNFPVTPSNIGGNLSATNHYVKNQYKTDVFVIAFSADASALLYSSYIGGVDNDFGNAIAMDQFANAYVTGQTLSTNFPATIDSPTSVSALQSRRNGTNDMFISIISPAN